MPQRYDRYLSGLGGNDSLYGARLDDILLGGEGDDFLFAEGGNDTLNGGNGNDRMFGGAGDDFYSVDSTGDSVIERSIPRSPLCF